MRFIKQAWLFVLLALSSMQVLAETTASSPIGEGVTQPSEHFGQIVLSLVLVLLIIFISAWLLRRYGRFPGVAEGNLKVLGALSVGQRERILLLQVGEDQILVGVTSSRISRLHQLEVPVEVKDNVPVTSQFSQRLQDALKPKGNNQQAREDT
ncbi:flagellar biosynthetic protein FliO [Thiomicrorhabdus lithotrophica]|uniref:Flagellar protein n=1 Tax=Thiomicrorhabdus lithotrophica TaxID=2949997 RepID=A0ABY8CBN4_9GAMM|nr:flagellar biosynthetic protein FliO [Thiomicrorhabdus lithotrophica]WEJ63389.1 flagellar biosynthetic protein FliO [Thiomicrorhabdus lithotrophica]